jgi:hypothetical protein
MYLTGTTFILYLFGVDGMATPYLLVATLTIGLRYRQVGTWRKKPPDAESAAVGARVPDSVVECPHLFGACGVCG